MSCMYYYDNISTSRRSSAKNALFQGSPYRKGRRWHGVDFKASVYVCYCDRRGILGVVGGWRRQGQISPGRVFFPEHQRLEIFSNDVEFSAPV